MDLTDDERLPLEFEIVIKEKRSGQSAMQWNGVFIGDPLTEQYPRSGRVSFS